MLGCGPYFGIFRGRLVLQVHVASQKIDKVDQLIRDMCPRAVCLSDVSQSQPLPTRCKARSEFEDSGDDCLRRSTPCCTRLALALALGLTEEERHVPQLIELHNPAWRADLSFCNAVESRIRNSGWSVCLSPRGTLGSAKIRRSLIARSGDWPAHVEEEEEEEEESCST